MTNLLLDDAQHDGLLITPQGKREILSGTKWAKFLAIVGIALTLFSLYSAVRTGASEIMVYNMMLGISSFYIRIFQLLMILIPLLPVWFLFQYANKATTAITNNDSQLLGEAMRWKKFFYTFYGITVVFMFLLGFFGFFYILSFANSMNHGF